MAAMTAILVSVHLPDVNGIPADDTINSFVFDSLGAAVPALCDAVHPLVQNFYNVLDVAYPGSALCHYLASNLDRGTNKARAECYLLAPNSDTGHAVTLPMGAPIDIVPFTLGPSDGTSDLPRECAAALSYHANLTGLAEDTPGGPSGPKGDLHPRARHRGRLFLGPFNNTVLGAGTNGPGLTANFRAGAAGAMKTLATAASTALEGLAWSVWSRVLGHMFPIVGGYVDDAFDTIRRRGIKSVARALWSL